MKASAENGKSLRDGIITLAGIALLLALLRMASDIVAPFLLALFVAIIAASPVAWLKQRGLSSRWSVVIVALVVIVLLVLLALMIGTTISQFDQSLPGYQARLEELTSGASVWLANKGIDVDGAGVVNAIDPSAIMGFANTLIVGIGDALSNAVLITFIVLFLLMEGSGYPRKLAAMDRYGSGKALQRIADIVRGVNAYAAAKAAVSLATGVLIWIGLELVGLDFAPLWGLIAFLLNFVPNIGSILAAIPPALVAVLQLDPTGILIVIGIYLAVNMVVGNILEPMIMGQKVGLSVLTVFLSLIFWGWMFGAVGVLLSVPLTMVVKFVADSTSQTRWFALLLSPAPSGDGDNELGTGLRKKA